jgi:hypothetical protein
MVGPDADTQESAMLLEEPSCQRLFAGEELGVKA